MGDVQQSNTPLRQSFTTKIGFCLVQLLDICSKQAEAFCVLGGSVSSAHKSRIVCIQSFICDKQAYIMYCALG